MKVILTENNNRLGEKYEVVEVKKGYGLKLIRDGVCIPASNENVKVANENLKQKKNKIEKLRKEAFDVLNKLQSIVFKYKVETDKNGIFKNEITSSNIAELIKSETGYEIHKGDIKFSNTIDKAGKYEVGVKLFKDIVAIVCVEIIIENKNK